MSILLFLMLNRRGYLVWFNHQGKEVIHIYLARDLAESEEEIRRIASGVCDTFELTVGSTLPKGKVKLRVIGEDDEVHLALQIQSAITDAEFEVFDPIQPKTG